MEVDELVFEETDHTYTVGNRLLPSVTTVIRPIGPDFSMIRADVLEQKRQLGTDVHLATELDDLEELDDEATDPLVMNYVRAWRKFKEESGAVILMNEQRLYHPTLGYAGTLDNLAELRLVGDGRWLLDKKTSANPVPAYGVQLSGYAELLFTNDPPAKGLRRGTVHLRADGTYRLKEFANPNDAAVFRALLSITHWKATNQ
jgi:hypothetical protein